MALYFLERKRKESLLDLYWTCTNTHSSGNARMVLPFGRPLLGRISSLPTTALRLDRWTFHRAVGAVHTTISQLRTKHRFACFAFVEELARVRWHHFLFRVPALWARQHRFEHLVCHWFTSLQLKESPLPPLPWSTPQGWFCPDRNSPWPFSFRNRPSHQSLPVLFPMPS